MKVHRGFESHPLRQLDKKQAPLGALFSFYPPMDPPRGVMPDGFNWTCPTCARHTTITSPNVKAKSMGLITNASPDDAGVHVRAVLIDCPNQDCQAQSFKIQVRRAVRDRHHSDIPDLDSTRSVGVGEFTFLPTSAQPLSRWAPSQVSEDYNEAYLIRALSPKASATLARRALQGMIRDFFQLPKLPTLHLELKAIEEKCEPEIFSAMMAMKSVGNIGAHPGREASLMVDVERGEPEALLDLIHLLDQEWYITRAEKAKRVERMRSIGASKVPALAQARLTPPT